MANGTAIHILHRSNIVMEPDDTNAVVAKYIRGINLIKNQDNEYFVFNAHGDVTQLTNSGGSVIKNYEYDAFGVGIGKDDNDTNPWRYCGEYWDEETGTIYLRARSYNPTTGRFLSEDSYRGKPNDPLSLNLYVYCGNNPIAYVDPSGHQRASGYYTINGVYRWYSDPDAWEFGKDSDTYKIIDDAGKRWNATTDKAERDRLHAIAENARFMFRLGTPYKFGNVIVMETLHENTETALRMKENIEIVQKNNLQSNPYLTSFAWLTGKHFATADNANWDYKWDPNWQVPYPEMWTRIEGEWRYLDMNEKASDGGSPKNWVEWIYFEGVLIGADKMANINWGYVGTSMGYGGPMLFNPLTSGGADDIYIQIGVDLANSGR